MLSLEQCEKILNKKKKHNKYTQDQIKAFRNAFYALANLSFENYSKKDNEKSNNLHESIY